MVDHSEEDEAEIFIKVRRGFSLSQGNESLVSEARSKMFHKIEETPENQAPYFKDSSNSTFLLPNLSTYPNEFRTFLEKNLIEQSTLQHLEKIGKLNWWCDNDCMQSLWPLATTGDGNCLLHAASLAMWGFHDRHLTLRHALHHRLIHDNHKFHRRWCYQSCCDEQNQGFKRSREEFESEWRQICTLSLTTPKGVSSSQVNNLSISNPDDKYLICCHDGKESLEATSSPKIKSHRHKNQNAQKSALKPVSINNRNSFYDFLEQIHVFVLAQVIRRPIIILSDSFVRDVDGNPIQPLLFSGLYLPLLEKPENCDKSPLLLAYSNSHFSGLVPMDHKTNDDCSNYLNLPLAIPLVDPNTNQHLTVHFALDPGEEWMKSMDTSKLSKNKQPDIRNLLNSYLCCEEFKYCPDHKRKSSQTDTSYETSSSESLGSEHQKNSLTRTLGKQIKDKFLKSKTKTDHTTSTKINKAFWDQFEHGGLLLGANLKITLPPKYTEMIDNYLREAKIDFNDKQTKCRRTSLELIVKEPNSVDSSLGDKKTMINSSSCNSHLGHSPNYFKNELTTNSGTCRVRNDTSNSSIGNVTSDLSCQMSNCTTYPKMENYCMNCYNSLPPCKSPGCKLRATQDDNYCSSCYHKMVRNI